MTLWDWAQTAYARPGAEGLCLELQETHGLGVSFLIWTAWMAREGRAPAPATLAEAAALARDWETRVLAPLRAARRELKRPLGGVSAEDRAALRSRILAEELAAERLALEALEARSPPPGPPYDTAAALAAAADAWGAAPPQALLQMLARAFSNT